MPDLELDSRVRRALTHELRVRALLALEERPASASQLAPRFGVEVNLMSYHMRELAKLELVQLVETRAAGPAVERFYAARAQGWATIVRQLNDLVG